METLAAQATTDENAMRLFAASKAFGMCALILSRKMQNQDALYNKLLTEARGLLEDVVAEEEADNVFQWCEAVVLRMDGNEMSEGG